MKLNNLSIIVKGEDNKIYQVLLNEKQKSLIENLIVNLHEGSIKVLNKPIETIDMIDSEKNKHEPKGLRRYLCNRCGNKQIGLTNYCENCGYESLIDVTSINDL